MIRNLLQLVLALAIVFIAGCSETQESSSVIEIQLSRNLSDNGVDKEYKISDFIASVERIKLETTKQSLLSFPKSIYFVDNKIFIHNKTMSKSNLLMFNSDGSFVKQISNEGRAENEHLGIHTVMFDEKKKEIMIYSSSNRKMLYFDYDGNYLRNTVFENFGVVRDITNLPDGGFLCYAFDILEEDMGSATGLWRVDSEGRFIKNYLYVAKEEKDYQLIFNLTQSKLDRISNDKIIISDGFRSKLYLYDYELDSLTNYVNYEIKGNDINNLLSTKYQNGSEYTISSASQIKGNYLFNQWMDPYMTSVYNLSTAEINFVDKVEFNYDLPVVKSWDMVQSNLSDAFVSLASSDKVVDYLNSDEVSESNKKIIREMYGDLTDDQILAENSLLQILKIKK